MCMCFPDFNFNKLICAVLCSIIGFIIYNAISINNFFSYYYHYNYQGFVARDISDQEILERCLYPLVNEGKVLICIY